MFVSLISAPASSSSRTTAELLSYGAANIRGVKPKASPSLTSYPSVIAAGASGASVSAQSIAETTLAQKNNNKNMAAFMYGPRTRTFLPYSMSGVST